LLISFEPSRELTSRFLGFVVTPSLIYARPSRVQLGFWLISLFNELFAFAGAKIGIFFTSTQIFLHIFFNIFSPHSTNIYFPALYKKNFFRQILFHIA
jgi:hypothetical protein